MNNHGAIGNMLLSSWHIVLHQRKVCVALSDDAVGMPRQAKPEHFLTPEWSKK